MKRILLIILACACIFSFSACKDTPEVPDETLPQETEAPATEAPVTEAPVTEAPATEAPVTEAPETEAPATDAPVQEEGSVFTTGAISFEYPKSWDVMDESIYTIITNPRIPGNNITVTIEPKNDYYETVDAEAYKKLLIPTYESMGITVDTVSLDRVENGNGAKFVQIVINGAASGVKIEQTQYIITAGNETYSVAITEINQDDALVKMVFDSISIDENAAQPDIVEEALPDLENTKTYTVEDLSFEYPGNWTDTGAQIVGEGRTGAIAVQIEAKNPIIHMFDTEMCKEFVTPMLEANGMKVNDIAVEHLENGNGERIVKIIVIAEAAGVEMEITEFLVSSANSTYIIALSSQKGGNGVADLVFNTISVVGEDTGAVTEWTETTTQTFGAISFDYPNNWLVEEYDGVILSESDESLVSIEVFSVPRENGEYDVEGYIQETQDTFAILGMEMENLLTETVKNGNGVEIIKISFEMDFLMRLYLTEFVINTEYESYSIQITEMSPDSPLIALVFDSITVSDSYVPEVPETEAPATDVTGETAENVISLDGVTFEYPAGWEMISETQAIDMTTGNNVNVVSEAKNVFYDTIDAEMYISGTKPIYEAAGMSIKDVTVDHVENAKGVKIVKIGFTAEISGISMRMTQFVVHSGDKTCTITVSETTPTEGLVDLIFESITVK